MKRDGTSNAIAPNFHVKSGSKTFGAVYFNCVSTENLGCAQHLAATVKQVSPDPAVLPSRLPRSDDKRLTVSQMPCSAGTARRDCFFRTTPSVSHLPWESPCSGLRVSLCEIDKWEGVTPSVKHSRVEHGWYIEHNVTLHCPAVVKDCLKYVLQIVGFNFLWSLSLKLWATGKLYWFKTRVQCRLWKCWL